MTFQTETKVKSTRKTHRCALCGTDIAAGSAAIRRSGIWEGDFFSEIGHPDCVAMWNEAFDDFGDTHEGMPYDLVEAMLDGATDAETRDTLNAFRGKFPHPVCRIELRLLKSDLRRVERLRACGYEPDDDEVPEIYA